MKSYVFGYFQLNYDYSKYQKNGLTLHLNVKHIQHSNNYY